MIVPAFVYFFTALSMYIYTFLAYTRSWMDFDLFVLFEPDLEKEKYA